MRGVSSIGGRTATTVTLENTEPDHKRISEKKKETFAHVMGKVLDFEKDAPMTKAMGEFEYDSIEDVVTMDEEEVMRILYTITKEDKFIELTKDVPMKLKKKLLHLLWWHDHEVLLRA
eukprot:2504062-Ditylum_brightwellii.AAC.1